MKSPFLALPRRVFRTWIVGLALLVMGANHALPQAQPSIAPEGEFLPNDPYILPTPPVLAKFWGRVP
jgi:hypothetical protein